MSGEEVRSNDGVMTVSDAGVNPRMTTGRAAADYVIGHILTNTIAGPTFFAGLNQWDPKAAETLMGFFRDDLKLGEPMPAVLPIMINVVPMFIAAIEITIRYCTGRLTTKADEEVHTPFPKISSFHRSEALFAITFLTMLQVVNGFANMQPESMGRYGEVSRNFFSTSAAAFLGQILLSKMFFELFTKAILPAGHYVAPKVAHYAGVAGTAAVEGASSLFKKVKECCKSDSESQPLVTTADTVLSLNSSPV